jgi:hypothetical protein
MRKEVDSQCYYSVTWKQFLNSNDKAVLGPSQNEACTDLFEYLSVKSLKRDLANDTTFNPPLFSRPIPLKSIPFGFSHCFTVKV